MMKAISENISKEHVSTSQLRDEIDVLRSRLFILGKDDRLLMTMYLENGNTYSQMAQLAGTNQSNISRRIHRITKRLLDGKYIHCLRNRKQFSPFELSIARDYFARGISLRAISIKRGLSYNRLRNTLAKIKVIIKDESTKQSRCNSKNHTMSRRDKLS